MSINNPPKWIAKPLVPIERVPAPEWFIHGMLPENGLAVLYGQPGSFKTFEFVAVAMCLATGLPFCGRRTKRCSVLLIAADPDPDTPRERAQAWTTHHEPVLKERGIVDFSNAVMFEKAVNLHKEEEVRYAADAIKQQGLKPHVILFDTLFHSSIGADLIKPEHMLPIIERARWLMAEVGARTGFIAHHTPKDGKTLFGTQALLATVDVVWRSDATDVNKATLSCERIKRARVFTPIELTFQSMNLQMAPNSFGDEWIEQLVLTGDVQPAAKAKSREDQDLKEMVFMLEHYLGNKATFTAWLEQMWKFAGVKKDDKDKKGWSKRSFTRKLDILKNTGRVTGGGKQGDLYSVVHTHGNTTAAANPVSVEPVSPKLVPGAIPKGDGTCGTGFDGGQVVPSWCHDASGTGSSNSRNASDLVVSSSDVLKAAREQLRKGKAA